MRSRFSYSLAWASASALVGVVAIMIGPVADLEERLGLQWLFGFRGPVRAPTEVVVVALDEQSDRDPDRPRSWPRHQHAELVRYLSKVGARVIAFDLTFETPSPNPAHDEEFAQAIGAAGNVLLTESIHRVGEGTLIETPPIPLLSQVALGHAPFLLPKDSRVSVYWTSFPGASGGSPTLPVLAFYAYVARENGTAGKMRVNRSSVRPYSSGDASYLNFYGPPRTVVTVPYSSVLTWARSVDALDAGRDGATTFRGKAVFVGYSAATQAGQDRLRDDYRTVYSQSDGLDISGVEIAATAFANLVEDRELRPLTLAWQLAIVTAWGLVVGFACRLFRPLHASAVVAAMAATYLWVAYDRFVVAAWWLPSIIPIGIQAPLALFAGVWLSYRDSGREREAVKRAFGYFLPGAVVDQLARNVGPVTRDNQVVFGACLATDAEKYTTLAEQMNPGQLGELMNAYYAELFVPVERSHGVVVDIVGDAMVAIWAKSSSGIELRRNACNAALEIVEGLDRFNSAVPDRPALSTRLGLHAGDMLVGSIGASGHYEYRAVGDIVNTASRIQGLNKVLGTHLLASETAVEGLTGFSTRPLGSFLLAGKSNAVAVVELLSAAGNSGGLQSSLCTLFAEALDAYCTSQWSVAASRFSRILESVPNDGPSQFYLDQCLRLLVAPPNREWTPTIRLANK